MTKMNKNELIEKIIIEKNEYIARREMYEDKIVKIEGDGRLSIDSKKIRIRRYKASIVRIDERIEVIDMIIDKLSQ